MFSKRTSHCWYSYTERKRFNKMLSFHVKRTHGGGGKVIGVRLKEGREKEKYISSLLEEKKYIWTMNERKG